MHLASGSRGEPSTTVGTAPTLGERIARTLSSCHEALATAEIAQAEDVLARRGVTDGRRVELLRHFARRHQPPPELLAARDELARERGIAADSGALERALLVRTALSAIEELPALPVEESVKHLMCKEFEFYAQPPAFARPRFSFEQNIYIAMSRIVLVERFPAGQSHWEISGFPRRWLLKVSPRYRASTLRFLALKMRGLGPYFVAHLGETRSRLPCLLERQSPASFYRFAASLEKQPAIRGMMAGSWLHSLETHRVSPHLAFLNRLYLEVGGIYTELGPADPSDGFLDGDPHRAELYRKGEYRPTFGLVMCSREQAIAWKRAHPELASQTAVR